MMKASFLIVFATLWSSLSASTIPETDESTLRLIHVVFRHGHRNPDVGSLIPDTPYYNESYYPEGYGQLTNQGKLREYTIGLLLRQRYDDFFGDTWRINHVDARSTNINRTKMSLELALAGLYTPVGEQLWSLLLWQPIPYNYKATEDYEILPWATCGTKLDTLVDEIINSDEMVAYAERYADLLDVLREKTGSDDIDVLSPFNYYFGFATQEEVGYDLEDWVYDIYPEPMKSAAVDYYYYITNTTATRKIVHGYLLKKILEDTKAKINGTISPSDRKAFFYSGHEMNVASALLSVDAYKLTEIPPYGSHVIYEVHEVDSVWGLRLFYQNYAAFDPIPLKIEGCDYFCSFDDFSSLVADIIPDSTDDCLV